MLIACLTTARCRPSAVEDRQQLSSEDRVVNRNPRKQQNADPRVALAPISHRYIPTQNSKDAGNSGAAGFRIMVMAAAVPGSMPQLGFRFWVDEVLWSKGKTATVLIETALEAAGGVRTGGPSRQHANARLDEQQLGYNHVDRWELLWTKSTYAIRAARSLRPGQLVSAVVGLNVLTMKKKLVDTLKAAYHDAAFQIMPVSFAVPEELQAWKNYLHKLKGQAPKLWILKTGQDAGKGLKLLPTKEALREAAKPPDSSKHKLQLKVVQAYIGRPMLLEQRKWHLRVWVLVITHSPLLAYIHRRGLVLFSSEPYHAGQPMGSAYGELAKGHVTNYAQNTNGLVWSLHTLRDRLGEEQYTAVWDSVVHSCALAVAAAAGPMQEAYAWLAPSIPDYGFQMMGADFMFDDHWHPWLLEFNSSPSIMAEHDDPATQQLIYEQKMAMLNDMVGIISHRLHPPESPAAATSQSASGAASSSGDAVAGTAGTAIAVLPKQLGEFLPLMPFFPNNAS